MDSALPVSAAHCAAVCWMREQMRAIDGGGHDLHSIFRCRLS